MFSISRKILSGTSRFDQILKLSTSAIKFDRKLNEPITPNEMHRAGGIATFMRLPTAENHEKARDTNLKQSLTCDMCTVTQNLLVRL